MSDKQKISAQCEQEPLHRIVSMVEDIVRPMLSFPEEFRPEIKTSGEIALLVLNVSPDDLSKVTGREGRIAESLQTVVRAFSVRYSREVYLEIVATR